MSGIEDFTMTSNELTIKFDSVEMANEFKTWLCEQGEQDYWTWMEYGSGDEDDGRNDKNTAHHFDYHSEHNKITASHE